MDNILKQSTSVTIVMGVMVDSTDGNTPETGLTIAQADIRLSKNGGAYAQSNNVAGATHMETGKYSVPLDTTDTATLGKVRVDIHVSGALAVWREFTVVPANAYDALVLGTDVLTADLTQIEGVAQSATDLKDFADAGYDPATNKVQGVVLADTVTALTGHTAQTGDNYARLGAPAGVSIAADLVVIDNLVDDLETRLSAVRAGYLDNLSAGAVALASGVDLTKIHGVALTETIDGYLAAAFTKLFDVVTPLLVSSDVMRGTDSASIHSAADVWAVVARTLTANTNFNDPTSVAIADAVWDELISGHVIAGSFGAKNQNVVPSETIEDYKADVSALATDAALSTHDVKLDTVDGIVDNILLDTNELQTDWANGGRLDLIIDLILADTAELQTDWTNDGRLDVILDAVKAKTDNLPSGISKNVALSNFQLFMVLSSDHVTAATGKTITGTISKDGSSFSALTNAVSEIGNGMYKVNLTQAEMNADVITLKFTETDSDQRIITVYTT